MTQSEERTNQLDLQEQEFSNSGFNRRQFMGFGAAAAAALILPKSAQANPGILGRGTLLAQASPTCTPPSLTPPSDTSFSQPNVIASKANGTDNYCTLTSTLNVVGKKYSDVGDPNTYVRAFQEDGADETLALSPGPTLCVNPGDLIELTVNNNLNQANNGQGVDPNYCPGTLNRPNCFDDINMHFHGLHVSPISVGTYDQTGATVYLSSADPRVGNGVTLVSSSDDVLYDLKSGNSHLYCPWLPKFHAPGTHWYHAHRHGSTAIQVAGGMVGALIVQEPSGQEILRGAPDVVMIIQEEPQSGPNGTTAQEKLDRGIYEITGGTAGKFRINGVYQPTLNVQQGEIQRWRIINANSTPRAFTFLQLQDSSGNPVAWYRVAVDGITLYGKSLNNSSVKFDSTTNPNGVPFAPGNRVDMLVNLPSTAGTYTLQMVADPNVNASKNQLLATINVGNTTYSKKDELAKLFGDLKKDGIPTAGKPAYLNPITTFQQNQTPIAFQAAGGGAGAGNPGKGNFTIDNGKYDPTNLANIQANLNSSQEWIVANSKGGAPHPLHIHVNPFLVVATATITTDAKNVINNANSTQQQIYDALSGLEWQNNPVGGNGIDPTIWWDSFTIPVGTAYKIRHRFDDYWGNYVLHCHILIHEDQGMMWNVQVNNVQNKGANPCQQLLTPVVTAVATKY